MNESQSQSQAQAQAAGRRDDTAARRCACLAAHRRLAALRFALEEHEANALLVLRGRGAGEVDAIGHPASVASSVA